MRIRKPAAEPEPVNPARFCLWCGAPLADRDLEGRRLRACTRCDFVLWPDPKLATAVVVETAAGIVLGRRSIDPGRGLWCLPGGFVDDDEHPEQAAVRECREEIRAEVVIVGTVGIYHVRRSQRPHLVLVGYRGRLAAGERASVGHEMDEVGVFPPREAPPLAFSSHRELLHDWSEKWESSWLEIQ
jgi:ADP-ribose pyrophosphatase YjhB (NUDIX family)